MDSDLKIALAAQPRDIEDIAGEMGIARRFLHPYGRDKTKVSLSLFDEYPNKKPGKLILVTAINPTPAGEGKTTMSIGLADGMRKIGLDTALALREPSLGPVFGVKGGATGGGYAQAIPMTDINLHFTGEQFAVRHDR